MLGATSALLPSAELDPQRDTLGDAKHLSMHAAGRCHLGAADESACGIPCRDQRCSADGIDGGGCGVAARTGHRGRRVDCDRSGRPRAGSGWGLDLSRTVGWFTSVFPVRLDVGAINMDEALAGGAGAGRALKQVKEQLRAVPGHGSAMGCCAI